MWLSTHAILVRVLVFIRQNDNGIPQSCRLNWSTLDVPGILLFARQKEQQMISQDQCFPAVNKTRRQVNFYVSARGERGPPSPQNHVS